MTSKVDPRTVRVNLFLMPYTYNIGIQMKRKELSKTFVMISRFIQKYFNIFRVKAKIPN